MSEDEDKTDGALRSRIYTDLILPNLPELRSSAKAIAKTIDRLMDPFRAFNWGWDKMKWAAHAVADKLDRAGVEPDDVMQPHPTIAIPLLDGLKAAQFDERLREMFLNLLCSSMTSEAVAMAHPALVETLKQLSPDEARILDYVARSKAGSIFPWDTEGHVADFDYRFKGLCKDAKVDHISHARVYFENLLRLGLLHISTSQTELERRYSEIGEGASEPEYRTRAIRRIGISAFGLRLIHACVITPEEWAIHRQVSSGQSR